MTRSVLSVLATVALAACAQLATYVDHDPLITDYGPIPDHGFCGVAFGMTAFEAEQAFVLPLIAYDGIDLGDEPSCYLLFPEGCPDELTFIVVDGEVVRIDVRTPGVRSETGVGVGLAEAEVFCAYAGLLQILPSKYDPGVQDVFVGEQERRLVFQTDGETVTEYRVGPKLGSYVLSVQEQCENIGCLIKRYGQR